MTEAISEPQHAAFFTAGQAVTAWREGLTIERIFFLPERDEVWLDIEEPPLPADDEHWRIQDHKNARSLIRALLAGPAAQERYAFGGCSDDIASGRDAFTADRIVWRAVDLAGQIPAGRPILRLLWREVRAFTESDAGWGAIGVIAEMLQACGELTGSEVNEFARHAMCRTS